MTRCEVVCWAAALALGVACGESGESTGTSSGGDGTGTEAGGGAAGDDAGEDAAGRPATVTGGSAGSGGGAEAGASDAGGTGGAAGLDLSVTCDDGTDCVLVHATCCGYSCGSSALVEYVAVRSDSYAELREALCEGQDPENCPNCPAYVQSNYVSVCRAGECQAVDVREDLLSRCDTAADCRLRMGGECCERCDLDLGGVPGEVLIAVSALESWSARVCEDVPGCPPCPDRTYPADASAVCVGGHCAVSRE